MNLAHGSSRYAPGRDRSRERSLDSGSAVDRQGKHALVDHGEVGRGWVLQDGPDSAVDRETSVSSGDLRRMEEDSYRPD